MSNYVFLCGSILILSLFFTVPGSAQGAVTRDFTANVTSGPSPLNVLFTDISTIPVIDNSRRWDFGDGTIVMDPVGTVAHTYLGEGSFTVRLDRTDSEGYHSLIKYAYINVVFPTPTPTTTPTTIPTTTPPTTMPTTSPTTETPTTPTTAPTTVPTTQPTVQIPSEFYGQATASAIPVPVGSSIIARIGSRDAGEVPVTTPGMYGGSGPFDQRLKVYATTEEIGAGVVTITFWLNGTIQAGQTTDFQTGSARNLPLAFGSVTPTPTTTSTTTPTTSPTTTVTTVIPTTTPATTVTTVIPTTGTSLPTTTPTGTTPVPTTSTTVPTTTPTITPTATPTGVPDFVLTFEPGWNHVSIPKVLVAGVDTGAIFSPVQTDGHSIWRYNATSQHFERIYPVTRLNPTDSLWVYSSGYTTVPLYFSRQQVLIERDLIIGWNGFGIPNLTGVPARDAFSPVSDSWDYSYGYDAVNQRYDISIVKNGKGGHSDSRTLNPGEGYWLHMGENATFRALLVGT